MSGLTMHGAIRCSGTPYVERYRAPPGPFVEVAVTSKNVCALRGDDVVECWGDWFGNGAGPERCKVTEAKLTWEGTMLAFQTGERPWLSGSRNAGTWRAGTKLESSTYPDNDFSPFVFLLGKGASQSGAGRPTQLLPPDSEVELTQSVWALHATRASSGELLCTAPGTNAKIKKNGDELAVALNNVASLGSCPGSPVSGQLAWYGQHWRRNVELDQRRDVQPPRSARLQN